MNSKYPPEAYEALGINPITYGKCMAEAFESVYCNKFTYGDCKHETHELRACMTAYIMKNNNMYIERAYGRDWRKAKTEGVSETGDKLIDHGLLRF